MEMSLVGALLDGKNDGQKAEDNERGKGWSGPAFSQGAPEGSHRISSSSSTNDFLPRTRRPRKLGCLRSLRGERSRGNCAETAHEAGENEKAAPKGGFLQHCCERSGRAQPRLLPIHHEPDPEEAEDHHRPGRGLRDLPGPISKVRLSASPPLPQVQT